MKTEKQMKQDFLDWLNWEGVAPDKDDPDYYTYHWGMQVWISCAKQMQKEYYENNKETN